MTTTWYCKYCYPFFGDIQQHSAHSDGVGSADETYLRARYRYGDDFAALTDHESFLGKLRAAYVPDKVKDGAFGEMMEVELVNSGPVTRSIENPSGSVKESNSDCAGDRMGEVG